MEIQKRLESLDKFYVILVLVLISMSVLLIFSFRGVFSLFLTAYEFDPSSLAAPTRVNSDKLLEAHDWAYNKPVEKLSQEL